MSRGHATTTTTITNDGDIGNDNNEVTSVYFIRNFTRMSH